MLKPKFQSRVDTVDNLVQIAGLTGFTHEEHWNKKTVVCNTTTEEFKSIHSALHGDMLNGVFFEVGEKINFDYEDNRQYFTVKLIDGHKCDERDFSHDRPTMRVALESI